MPKNKVITSEIVREAGHLVNRALEVSEVSVKSPALDQIAAAQREHDPVARSRKTVAALKQGAHEMQAARDRLNQRKQQASELSENVDITVDFTPEARRELDILKDQILARIRRRSEEEMARTYPEQTETKRRPPPKRRLTV